ncbi:Uncharacterised protein [Mycobacteroides abscessus subsp. abscessus]|nr:Uncharacterised protein [Mycobacteroides abscessus subsp. abscessus]
MAPCLPKLSRSAAKSASILLSSAIFATSSAEASVDRAGSTAAA